MLSKKKLLSSIAGLAMLALPVSAFAGHKDDHPNRYRPYAWHDQGWHRGWDRHEFKHGPLAWNGGDNDDWGHRGYHRAWDGDGDSYRWVPNNQPNYYHPAWHPSANPNYRCDADGDDCHPVNNGGPAYWNNNGGYNYGEPYSWYQANPPAAYGLSQQRDWLIAKRQRAMQTLARMRARGDSRAAARMVPIVDALNRKITRLNNQLGGRYSANTVTPYAPAAYVPPTVGPNYAASGPDYGAPNYYGTATPYYANSALGTLNAIAAPLLGVR